MTVVIINETIRTIIEDAHMAGQVSAGVDPSYSEARLYCNGLFNESDNEGKEDER